MPFYRAVPKRDFDPDRTYEPQLTRRIPTNIPFVVDNIWEWLRPAKAPSRRQAVYASPTPELALANASSVGDNRDDYVVCELDIFRTTEYRVAHLNVSDARYHQDVRALTRHLFNKLGRDFGDMDVADKLVHAPLFLPAVSRGELQAYFDSSEQATALGQELSFLSTFWKDVELTPYSHDGELFLEFVQGAHYLLRPLA